MAIVDSCLTLLKDDLLPELENPELGGNGNKIYDLLSSKTFTVPLMGY